MNLYPVELCDFACLGALNHDRPIVACPDLALWRSCGMLSQGVWEKWKHAKLKAHLSENKQKAETGGVNSGWISLL